MADSKVATHPNMSVGEHALDGLIAGFGAGIVMALYVVLAGLLSGDGPAQALSRFDPSATPSPVTGTTVHLAVASIYGLLFGLISRWVARRRRLNALFSGLVYGLLIFVFAQFVILPSTTTALRELSAIHFAVAHAIYGLSLGFLFSHNP